MSTVISLCDLTGNFVQPWIEAGHDAILVDPQHGFTHTTGLITRLAATVEEALPELGDIIRSGDVAFVAAFPPCTQLAASGARWWAAKRADDYMFQAKAVAVAEQCRTLAIASGAPYFVENPKGALAKETYLWTGNGFRMPSPCRDLSLGAPDDRIHKAPPSAARANFRSATPMGFARAVFKANAPAAREVAA